eukprot:2904747-Pyramimonas_sp.AAC.1
MVATSEWDAWEDVPLGIRQGFVNKLSSRFPINFKDLNPALTTYKITMEVKSGSKSTVTLFSPTRHEQHPSGTSGQ